MTESYLARFLRVIEEEDRAVLTGPDADGHHLLVEYHGHGFDPPLVMDFNEHEFEAAVRAAGPGARSLWPDVHEVEAGFRILLVHFDESISGMKRPTSRVYVAEGQVWAE